MVTMETKTRQIKIVEEPVKRWSEPSCIITAEELAAAETEHDGCEPERQEQILDKNVEIVKRVHPAMRDIVIHSEQQEHVAQQAFKTPQKLVEHSNKLVNLTNMSPNIRPEKHRHSNSVLGDKSDWMLAERSDSRSPPSPAIMSRSPEVKCKSPLVHVSPAIHSNSNVFNFSPERTERYRAEIETETGRVKKRLFEGQSQGECC